MFRSRPRLPAEGQGPALRPVAAPPHDGAPGAQNSTSATWHAADLEPAVVPDLSMLARRRSHHGRPRAYRLPPFLPAQRPSASPAPWLAAMLAGPRRRDDPAGDPGHDPGDDPGVAVRRAAAGPGAAGDDSRRLHPVALPRSGLRRRRLRRHSRRSRRHDPDPDPRPLVLRHRGGLRSLRLRLRRATERRARPHRAGRPRDRLLPAARGPGSRLRRQGPGSHARAGQRQHAHDVPGLRPPRPAPRPALLRGGGGDGRGARPDGAHPPPHRQPGQGRGRGSRRGPRGGTRAARRRRLGPRGASARRQARGRAHDRRLAGHGDRSARHDGDDGPGGARRSHRPGARGRVLAPGAHTAADLVSSRRLPGHA
jgi:hypothetical protein